MNTFDFFLLLNPTLYGAAKFMTDLNRDSPTTSPLRAWFVALDKFTFGRFAFVKAWDNVDGGTKSVNDVWHIADFIKGVLFIVEAICLLFSDLGALVLQAPLLLQIVMLVSFAALSWYLVYAVFVLGYHHLFAAPGDRRPWSQFIRWLVAPWSNPYATERGNNARTE